MLRWTADEWSDSRRGDAVRLPVMRRGVPVCELHRTPLADDGPRTGVAQLKVMADDACVHRVTLDVGTTAALGRAPGAAGIALHDVLPRRLLDSVSRRHVEVTVDAEGALWLRDLSGRGSLLLPYGAREWTALSGETPALLRVNDVVELIPGVRLARSARRYPAEIAAAWQRAARRVPEASARAETRWE
ncbi:FHA domain-containing protein [Streptomyces sp. NBC_01525]|uniref:hypothetical protein n=1 Tax=Streptomyces sp. NBC_01525 TaxID=2903893 RepID=UPI0038708FDF